MRTFLEYIRTIVISFEFLIILVVALLIFFRPSFIETIRGKLNLTPDIVKYFALAPVACLGLILRDARKLLFPNEDKKKKLQCWEKYWKIRITVNVAIIYAIFFLIIALFAWIIDSAKHPDVTFVLIIGAILGSGIDYLSVYNAEIAINEIFSEN